MKITFRKPNMDSIDDFLLLEKWNLDNSINYLFMARPNKDYWELPLKLEMYHNFKTKKDQLVYLIEADGEVIGEMKLDFSFPYLYKKEEKTGWLSMVIGEKEYRNKGISKKAIGYMEKQAKKYGIKRIELGTFEFNYGARKAYERLGYKKIGAIENFTYYSGVGYCDYRYEKYL